MMGRQRQDQGKLFYEFRLDDRIPKTQETPLRRGTIGVRDRCCSWRNSTSEAPAVNRPPTETHHQAPS